MHRVLVVAQGLAMVSFGWYGMSCFVSEAVFAEHRRYGSDGLRTLTGVLQLGGSLGLLMGFFSRTMLISSAAGLAALMLAALLIRIRLRDPIMAMVPALVFLILNLFIVFMAL